MKVQKGDNMASESDVSFDSSQSDNLSMQGPVSRILNIRPRRQRSDDLKAIVTINSPRKKIVKDKGKRRSDTSLSSWFDFKEHMRK